MDGQFHARSESSCMEFVCKSVKETGIAILNSRESTASLNYSFNVHRHVLASACDSKSLNDPPCRHDTHDAQHRCPATFRPAPLQMNSSVRAPPPPHPEPSVPTMPRRRRRWGRRSSPIAVASSVAMPLSKGPQALLRLVMLRWRGGRQL